MVVVGLGLIGGSLALAARKAGLVGRIVGLDTDATHREMALASRMVDRVDGEVPGDLSTADLVVLAVPVTEIASLLPDVARRANGSCLVTDVGSAASHASIIAREYGIPAVVGCGDATARLRTGMRVTVDGGTGNVEPE